MDSAKQELQQLYQQTLQQLKSGKRPHLDIDSQCAQQIEHCWSQALATENKEDLLMILCLLDHARSALPGLSPYFENTLTQITDPEVAIFTLGASIKHVVTHSQLEGRPIRPEFIQILGQQITSNPKPEKLEWLLRVVEAMGKQGIKLQKQVRMAKPGLIGHLHPNRRACRQIVELLEKQWSFYVSG